MTLDIRGELLKEIASLLEQRNMSMQSQAVLRPVRDRLRNQQHDNLDQAILTQWSELFRTGYLAWGYDLSNAEPPFFHVTDRGKIIFSQLSRDPSNIVGYMQALENIAELNLVAKSYVVEGLDCFVSGLHKASAVMLGAASESLVLELRDLIAEYANNLPKKVNEQKIKSIIDGLHAYFESKKVGFDRELREKYEAHWLPITNFIRINRNEVGHPSSIEPISFENAHASFLLFPELVWLIDALGTWVKENHETE